WVWDSANANINLDPATSNPVTLVALAPGQQTYFYFNILLNRTSAAYDTMRGYHITVSATGLGQISTPTPRELYVEHLVSQNRNSVHSLSGPTSVQVGGVYTYTLNGGTATNGYEQLVAQLNFPTSIFQLLNVQ